MQNFRQIILKDKRTVYYEEENTNNLNLDIDYFIALSEICNL